MSRFIDADALIRKIQEGHKFGSLTITELISECPKADVVEVIRCEDCKHRHYFVNAHTDNYGTSVKAKVYCRVWQDWVPPEGYCFLADMRGERRWLI